MRASIAVAAVLAGAASAAYIPNAEESTVYSTKAVTITSCGPEVTNCPARQSTAAAVSSATAAPVESYTSSAAGPLLSSIPAVVSSKAPESSPAAGAGASSAPAGSAGSPASSGVAGAGASSLPAGAGASAESACSTATVTVYATGPAPTKSSASPYYPTSSGAAGAGATGSAGSPIGATGSAGSPISGVTPSAVYGPSGTGSPKITTSSAPASPQFTGAASHMNAGMAAAGLGAIAAMLM